MSLRVAVLASGTGTNLQAILDSVHGQEGIEVVGLGCDKPGALCLERARAVGVATGLFPRGDFPDRSARDRAMGDWLDEIGWDHASPPPELPPDVVAGTQRRYREAYDRITEVRS